MTSDQPPTGDEAQRAPNKLTAVPDELSAARQRTRSGSRTEADRRAAARRREQVRREATSRRSADSNREHSTTHRTIFMIVGVVVAAVVLFLLTHYL